MLSLLELEVFKGMWWNLTGDGGEDGSDKEEKCVGKWASLVLLFPSLFLKFFEGFKSKKVQERPPYFQISTNFLVKCIGR